MSMNDYASYDGLGLAELVAHRDVSPTELVEEAITRIERHNPTLNAVVYKMYDEGRATAARLTASGRSGPFHGVPFLLKDILGNYAGVPTAAGSRFMAGHPALQDDTLVTRFKAAGLVTLGKTNAPECGILPTTEPVFYGPCRNPWNVEYSTGGSSGGSAAAVAAGIVPIAHANDGGGSIRIPASCCGLVGMKPTRARNPLGPMLGDIMHGLIAEHVVTRTVRDSAAVLDCTHGPEPGDPYAAPAVERPFLEEVRRSPGTLRIAFARTNLLGEPLHPESVAAVESTAKLCEELGHVVEEASPAVGPSVSESFMVVWAAGLTFTVDAFAMVTGRVPKEEHFEGLTWGLYERGRAVSASQYQIAVAMLQIAGREIGRFHERYDCWLTPTLGAPTVKNGVIDLQERDVEKAFAPLQVYVPFTPVENATGQPAVSLPLHWTPEGLPLGLMFTGRLGDEATLYRLAGQLEQARPWIDRKPPLWG
jgi:amidase